MPYRLLLTNIPVHIGEEEFYDYLRAHPGGEAVVNAMLIVRPANAHAIQPRCSRAADQASAGPASLVSTGAALVDYATKSAADLAMRVNFYVDGSLAMLKAVGCVEVSGRHAEAIEMEGREMYRQLRCGLDNPHDANVSAAAAAAARAKCLVDASDGSVQEMELRLVGIPSDVYGCFLFDDGNTEAYGSDAPHTYVESAARRSNVQLFMDVALSIRRTTLGELLSMRRISADEAMIRVSETTGEALLERGEKGLDLVLSAASESAPELFDSKWTRCTLAIRPPRPSVRLDDDNFALAKKQEVLQAMSRVMEFTNAKVAGFLDPFGNLLLPSC